MTTSVVIPNWNGRDLLEKNLPSVMGIGADEVMVVDDASTDGSVEFLRKKYPGIKVLVNKSRVGFPSNVNRGVAVCRGDVVILLNSDVAPAKDLLNAVLPHFKDEKIFGVSFNEGGYSYALPEIKNGFIGHRPGPKTNREHPTFWVSGGSGAFRKSRWDKLGGFDTLYSPFYWEDLDLSYRALKRGWKLLWEPKAVVEHKHESTINTKNFSQRYLNHIKERNQLLFQWRHVDTSWLLTRHLPGLISRLQHPGYLIVIFLAVLKLPALLVKRLIEKSESVVSNENVLESFNVKI